MKRFKFTILLAAAALMLLPACKPTEKNYKAAYDAAIQKRQKDATDPDIYIPGGKLIDDNAPQTQTIGGKEYFVRYEPLKLIDGEGPLQRYNVAVAAYKMNANALSHRERLSQDYSGAIVAQNDKEMLIVCIGSYATPEEAAQSVTRFTERHPDATCVGLNSAVPVIIGASNVH